MAITMTSYPFSLKTRTFFLAALILLSGCSVVSKELRKEIDYNITFEELKANPEGFVGKTVLLGGEIIETTNLKDESLIEILEKPLGTRDQPKDVDYSGGRFIVKVDGFLDKAVYRAGRPITVVGEVIGKEKKSVGEFEYLYPVLKAKEIHLWEKPKEFRYYYDPYYRPFYPPYYYPYYPYYPYGWY